MGRQIWEDSKLTPIQAPEPDSAMSDAQFAVWSEDNWLVWQAGRKLFVWDGMKNIEISPDAESNNQNPVWEPIQR